ncbi:class I SAM-dependent methyltransferase [Stieleria sp. TO1_6]|uniref:class I SAM-dependent methyltransferase n=1 Tax=Stieleria tagensis TaxID=2956795 RepID=UPI00209AE0AD|nr:class I SAM-dependent methyltransferase [Stieleria tagensis]MCO8120727.1 class I SAM-dependent methyltransferase [Stieleria tagensis]
MDTQQFNRAAWDNIATSRHQWFTPCTGDQIDAAGRGEFSIRLTACKPIPGEWIGPVAGKRILALAAGGGHQGPILAAAGADVTVVDFSEAQLAIDRAVAERHQLALQTMQADMTDLAMIQSNAFDMVINPCSVNFVENVRPVWGEAARVLRPGGVLITGLMQPVNFIFDPVKRDRGKLKVRFRIPYSDLDLSADELDDTIGPERPIDFGHSLTDLVGGQLDAGLMITDIMEDRWGGEDVLSDRIATFLATRAIKATPNQS